MRVKFAIALGIFGLLVAGAMAFKAVTGQCPIQALRGGRCDAPAAEAPAQ